MQILQQLEKRRKEVGMSRSILAKRSGVSLPTVNRILSDHSTSASFANVLAIASALDMKITAEKESPNSDFRKNQAMKKARYLVRLVQGTSALEGQGLDQDELEEMIDRTSMELLPTKRKLWGI
tara:strand:+ start:2232 stop:2603 length:372 start_codon:yes stop_codon:yes gene_type:complete